MIQPKTRLIVIIAAGAAVSAAMFYSILAQAPPLSQAPGAGAPAAAQAAIPAILQKYAPVTAERLKNPEPGNWLMVRRTYDGWGHSPLKEINTRNVSKLRPVWGMLTGEGKVHEAAPIVNNGVMFISTPNN